MYIKPVNERVLSDLFVFVFDLQEIQLLILPVGIKMVQFGLRYQMAQSEAEKEALRSELAILKSELEPHFVYNVLNSAYAKILPVSKAAAGYLEQLSRLLRYTLYETTGDWVPLPREIRGLKRYLQLERLRHGRRFSIQWRQQGVLANQLSIPTLLLITLGENAVKHGVSARKGKTLIEVDIKIESNTLSFAIENETAEGNARKSRKTSEGIGLKNIQRRLQILYPAAHSVQITQQDGRYKVHIVIPLLLPLN
jgi:two-component system LytT family sensor kinase